MSDAWADYADYLKDRADEQMLREREPDENRPDGYADWAAGVVEATLQSQGDDLVWMVVRCADKIAVQVPLVTLDADSAVRLANELLATAELIYRSETGTDDREIEPCSTCGGGRCHFDDHGRLVPSREYGPCGKHGVA